MKINIINGYNTEEKIKKCYDVLADKAKKELVTNPDLLNFIKAGQKKSDHISDHSMFAKCAK